jgi:hypothetical protein
MVLQQHHCTASTSTTGSHCRTTFSRTLDRSRGGPFLYAAPSSPATTMEIQEGGNPAQRMATQRHTLEEGGADGDAGAGSFTGLSSAGTKLEEDLAAWGDPWRQA